MNNLNLSDKQILALMIEDAKSYLSEYIAKNGCSSVTGNAQKRIDVLVERYNNAK